MIHNPQIFVIFEPGMFGTFLCSLFMKQKLWRGNNLNLTFPGDQYHINAHGSGYKDALRHFHTHAHSVSLLEKNNNELIDFFKPLQAIDLGIHRLASYKFLKINFKKYFSRFVVVLVKPELDRLDVYGERLDKSTPKDYQTQWWAKNASKKNLNKLPKFFLEKMSIKEKQKYIKNHMDWLNNFIEIDQKNTIVFDPDDIIHSNMLQKMTDKVCNSLGIDNFEIPFDKIQRFIDKNERYLK